MIQGIVKDTRFVTTKGPSVRGKKSQRLQHGSGGLFDVDAARCTSTGATPGAWLLRLICCVLAGMLFIDTARGQANSNDIRRSYDYILDAATRALGISSEFPPLDHNRPASQPTGRFHEASGREVNAELTRRIWESRISAPDPTEDTKAKQDLQELIQQVRGLRFERNEATPSFSSTTEARPEPNRSSRTVDRQPVASTPSKTASTITTRPAEVEELDGLLQDRQRAPNPLEAAELLFLSGHPVEAIPFYEKALAQTNRTDPTTSADRAWILFQLGNSFRETDMTKARDMYQRLIAEYPNSPWTELAKAHGRLITWHLTAKPQQLMAPVQPD